MKSDLTANHALRNLTTYALLDLINTESIERTCFCPKEIILVRGGGGGGGDNVFFPNTNMCVFMTNC